MTNAILSPSDIGLTKGIQTKIKQLVEVSVPCVNRIVQQPTFNGSDYTLADLINITHELSQSPLNPRKVKDIITKTDTGLINNDFYLFNPILVGYVRGEYDAKYIISGRHRLEALFIIASLCGMPFDTTTVAVIEMKFDSMELLATSIAAYNTNRTMTKPERERVMIAADMNGKKPILENLKGNVGTTKKCEKFFKQIVYRTILDNTPEDIQKNLLTEYTVYKVSTYLWKLFTEDELSLLKKADNEFWSKLVVAILGFTQQGKFIKPNYNISRDTKALEDMALEIYGILC